MMDRKEFLKVASLIAAGAVIPKPLLRQLPKAKGVIQEESHHITIYTKDLIQVEFSESIPSVEYNYPPDELLMPLRTNSFSLAMELDKFMEYRLRPGDMVNIVYEQDHISYTLSSGTVIQTLVTDNLGMIEGIGGIAAWTAND